MSMENEAVEKGWGQVAPLRGSAARLLPALQVEVREPPGCPLGALQSLPLLGPRPALPDPPFPNAQLGPEN